MAVFMLSSGPMAKKSRAAASLARKRWANVSQAERSELMRRAVQKRWLLAKKRKKKDSRDS